MEPAGGEPIIRPMSAPRHPIQRPEGLAPGTVTWLEIDRSAVAANVGAFRQRLGESSRLAVVVKANAYGHGVGIVAPAALAAGADWLAVWGLDEGMALRLIVGEGVPILLLGHTVPEDFEDALAHDLRLTFYDPQALGLLREAALAAGKTARLHLKVETGTHRQGLPPAEVVALAQQIAAIPELEFEGLSTHFADIEDTTDHNFADAQRRVFNETAQQLAALGVGPKVRHTACSAAAILFPDTHYEMARVGISLYGLWPSRETLISARERGLNGLDLHPVLSWKALVAQVKDVPVGGYVGYGRTWRATRPTRIAAIPVGYYEGYPRALSNRAHLLIHGRRAPLLGRVCMNLLMADVTDIPEVRAGDVAVLIGRSGDELLRAEDLANWAGTIHYEVVSRINPRLPRLAV